MEEEEVAMDVAHIRKMKKNPNLIITMLLQEGEVEDEEGEVVMALPILIFNATIAKSMGICKHIVERKWPIKDKMNQVLCMKMFKKRKVMKLSYLLVMSLRMFVVIFGILIVVVVTT